MIRVPGDSVNLVDCFLKDLNGMLTARSLGPQLVELFPERLGDFCIAHDRVNE